MGEARSQQELLILQAPLYELNFFSVLFVFLFYTAHICEMLETCLYVACKTWQRFPSYTVAGDGCGLSG